MKTPRRLRQGRDRHVPAIMPHRTAFEICAAGRRVAPVEAVRRARQNRRATTSAPRWRRCAPFRSPCQVDRPVDTHRGITRIELQPLRFKSGTTRGPQDRRQRKRLLRGQALMAGGALVFTQYDRVRIPQLHQPAIPAGGHAQDRRQRKRLEGPSPDGRRRYFTIRPCRSTHHWHRQCRCRRAQQCRCRIEDGLC